MRHSETGGSASCLIRTRKRPCLHIPGLLTRGPVPARYSERVNLTIELDREGDGRWIPEALEIPGVMCYGHTREEAVSNTERLAIEVIAERIGHKELPSSALNLSFFVTDEQLARH